MILNPNKEIEKYIAEAEDIDSEYGDDPLLSDYDGFQFDLMDDDDDVYDGYHGYSIDHDYSMNH